MTIYCFHLENNCFILFPNVAFLLLHEKVYFIYLYCVVRNSTKLLLPTETKPSKNVTSFLIKSLMPSIIPLR